LFGHPKLHRREKKEKHPPIVNAWLVIPAILHPSNWKTLFGYLVYQIRMCLSVLGNALRVKKIRLEFLNNSERWQ